MLLELILASALATFPKPVTGDFDHDGKDDIAEVIEQARGKYVLRVRRAARPRQSITIDTLDNPSNFFLEKAAPGVEATACAKGYGIETDCRVTSVTITGDTLAFGALEASMAVAIWNGRTFDVTWLSD